MTEPSWKLEDAQQRAEEFPYTFYKPSKEVLSQLAEGDFVKLIFSFESDDPEGPSAERMWVIVESISGDGSFSGVLDNDPRYIIDLECGDPIEFTNCNIIDTSLDDPIPSIADKYSKRCFVTNNILYDGAKVGYLYREKPEYEGDSGWRLTTGAETDAYMDDPENSSYVSLGAVLEKDDSIADILGREAGIAFFRDDGGNFVELQGDNRST